MSFTPLHSRADVFRLVIHAAALTRRRRRRTLLYDFWVALSRCIPVGIGPGGSSRRERCAAAPFFVFAPIWRDGSVASLRLASARRELATSSPYSGTCEFVGRATALGGVRADSPFSRGGLQAPVWVPSALQCIYASLATGRGGHPVPLYRCSSGDGYDVPGARCIDGPGCPRGY